MELLLIVSYDITNDKGRTKISKELEKAGFTRIQYSVFAGVAAEAQWKICRRKIDSLFNKYREADDKLYVIPQSHKMFEQTGMLGVEFDVNWVMGKVHTLYY